MMKKILFIALCYASAMFAQDPIFDPAMNITEFGNVDSPVGEEVDKIIDGDELTKFLDFELADGMGFTVDLGGTARTAFSMTVTTANDFPVRDPIDFEVLGSNDGVSFTSVASGTIDCIPDRFFTRSYSFSNSTAYLHYRVNFSDACDPTGGTGFPSIQVAEVQLFEEILGVGDKSLSANEISIFPNPNSGTFTIDYVGTAVLQELFVVDVTGKVIEEFDLLQFKNRQQFNISSLNSGVYFLKISSRETTVTKKIVVK